VHGAEKDGSLRRDDGFTIQKRMLSPAAASSGDERIKAKSPVTVCHMSVTVRQRSPRFESGATQGDSPAATPVPALRRAGTHPKRTLASPSSRRRVTFSDERRRRPQFASRFQHSAAAALDTLWNYHDTYPWMQSQPLKNVDVRMPKSVDPETARNANENGSTQQSGEVTEKLAELNDPAVPGDDDEHYQAERQRGTTDVEDTVDEKASLSIKQLVASFESMTCPYMRVPATTRRTP